MTNENSDFETWYRHFRELVGNGNGIPEQWREDYDAGRTPEETFKLWA